MTALGDSLRCSGTPGPTHARALRTKKIPTSVPTPRAAGRRVAKSFVRCRSGKAWWGNSCERRPGSIRLRRKTAGWDDNYLASCFPSADSPTEWEAVHALAQDEVRAIAIALFRDKPRSSMGSEGVDQIS
jgi:hypothetical protein